MSNYKRVFSFLAPYKFLIMSSLVLAFLFAAANALFLPLVRDIVRELGNANMKHFSNHILNAVVLYLLRLIFQYGQKYVSHCLSFRVCMDIQLKLYGHVLLLSQSFFVSNKVGDVMTRLFDDSGRVRDTVTRTFSEVIPQVLTFLGIVGWLFYNAPWLTLFSISVLPVFVVFISWTGGKLKMVVSQIQSYVEDVNQLSYETIGNLKLVQAYNMESVEVDRLKKTLWQHFQEHLRRFKLTSGTEYIISFCQFVVIVSILWYGGFRIISGHLTGAQLAAFFTGVLLLIDVVIALSRVYHQYREGFVSVDRIYEYLDIVPLIRDPEVPCKMPDIQGEVTFENVTFSYPDSQVPVLSNIDVTVRPGETVALVGLSGAGKSTLISLIPRFFDPQSGCIRVDGVDVRQIHLQVLRHSISMVLQDDILFRDTIYNNIAYGLHDVTKDAVERAAKLANAWDFIMEKPEGFQHVLSERGGNFSGGQKQRLSIARAILKDPKILILDEATSALDAQSEALVQVALEQLMKDRTTFVIAHRLSTIQHADRILVMDQGVLVEEGSHDELIRLNKAYAAFYKLQFSDKT